MERTKTNLWDTLKDIFAVIYAEAPDEASQDEED